MFHLHQYDMKAQRIIHLAAGYLFVLALAVTNFMTERRVEKRFEGQEKTIVKDTVIFSVETVTDTVTFTNVVYVDRLVLDTITVKEPSDTVFVVEQVHYLEEGEYELWVSGIYPKLDSISVYHTDSIVYVEKIVKIEEENRKFGLNAGCGISYVNKVIVPQCNVSFSMNGKDFFGLSASMYGFSPCFGVTYQRKIF